MAVPAPAVPAPVTVAPAAVVAMPMNLLGLQLRGFLAGGDGGMSVGIRLAACARDHRAAAAKAAPPVRLAVKAAALPPSTPNAKFQKVAALHNIFLSGIIVQVMQRSVAVHDMNRS